MADQPEDDDDRLDRLAADAELMAYLRKQNYQGPDWERFVHELLAYGLTRTKVMIAFSRIVLPATMTTRDFDALVNEIVECAFRRFLQHGIKDGEWSPEKGASLATYFAGRCKLVLKEKRRELRKHAWKIAAEQPRAEVPDSLAYDLDWHFDDYFDRVLEQLTAVELRIFFLKSEGLSHAEIGIRLGLSERAVEGRVSRARNRLEPLGGEAS